MPAPSLLWKELSRTLRYAVALRRTPRDAVGTAYWVEDQKHSLYVKVGVDAWRCYRMGSLQACLELFHRRPGQGARATDTLIADAVTGIPHRKTRVVRVTHLESKPATQRRLTAKLTPNELWQALEARGVPVVRRRVSARDVAAAEKALSCRLPRSYVDLVTTHGAPAVGERAKAPVEALSFAVLTPKEVVRFTRELRALEPELFEDPESLPRVQAQLERAVLFALGRDAGEGYVFLLDTADSAGEMRIGDYAHDYLEELDWRAKSKAVFPSLAAATLDAAKKIAGDFP